MDLDELKKSWNNIDEQLKEKELVKDESISQLVNYVSLHVKEMNRQSSLWRIIAIAMLTLFGIIMYHQEGIPHIFYIIIYSAAVPAILWDMFESRYMAKTKIDEMPLTTVILRFNKVHRWMIREQILGVLFILCVATTDFCVQQVWNEGIARILFFTAIWIACIGFAYYIFRKNFKRLQKIRKNLAELQELHED